MKHKVNEHGVLEVVHNPHNTDNDILILRQLLSGNHLNELEIERAFNLVKLLQNEVRVRLNQYK